MSEIRVTGGELRGRRLQVPRRGVRPTTEKVREAAFSILGDYKFTKRFDGYLGSMWSEVQDGLANGYLNRNTITTTMGMRFKF